MIYALIILVGLAVVVLAVAGSRRGARKAVTEASEVARTQPSADAPTPAKSVIESPAQVEKAREHTPPA